MEDIGSSIAKEDYQSSSEDAGSSIPRESDFGGIGSIIAMKGHPFTRKTEYAKKIATSLQCPMLSYEDFLAELHPPLSPKREEELFGIILRMALRHIYEEISKAVVIDFPFSSAWYLEQFTVMASLLSFKKVCVIVIECKPSNAYSWRLEFEKHMSEFSPRELEEIPWFKPKKWEDVEKAIEINPDYDEKSVQGHKLVSKLVVDPLFLDSIDDRILEAVKYMMTREDGDGSDVVPFHQWKQLQSSSLTTDLDCSKNVHNIVCKSRVEEGLTVDCAFCEKQVMMSDDDNAYYYYYYCKGCSLALHKGCAESSDPKTKEDINYACRTCKGKGEGYEECRTCAFEMYLRNRKRPTAISHVDTEEHLLLTSGVVAKGFYDQYRCVACGNFSSVWSLC